MTFSVPLSCTEYQFGAELLQEWELKCTWEGIALRPVRGSNTGAAPAPRGSSSAVPMAGDKVLPKSELLCRIAFLSKTKGRDPHIRTPCTSSKQLPYCLQELLPSAVLGFPLYSVLLTVIDRNYCARNTSLSAKSEVEVEISVTQKLATTKHDSYVLFFEVIGILAETIAKTLA